MHSHLRDVGVRSVCRPASSVGIVAWIAVLFSLSLAALAPAQGSLPEPSSVSVHKLRVVVTVPPLLGIVKPLVPAGSEVRLLMPPGRSEHGYEFTPSDLAAVARADILIYVGLGLEPRIEREVKERPLAGRVVVCMSESLGIRLPEHAPGGTDEKVEDHEHSADCEHHHGPIDQHLWLDPKLVERFVPVLADAIKSIHVARGAAKLGVDVEDASQRLLGEIRELDALYARRLEPLKGAAIVTHHNAFSRLAERYGLVVADSIREFENSDPTPKEIEQLVKTIREKNVSTIFIEPNYNATVAQRIAKAAGVKLGRLDPLGDGDWLKMMRSNLDQLASHLAPRSK